MFDWRCSFSQQAMIGMAWSIHYSNIRSYGFYLFGRPVLVTHTLFRCLHYSNPHCKSDTPPTPLSLHLHLHPSRAVLQAHGLANISGYSKAPAWLPTLTFLSEHSICVTSRVKVSWQDFCMTSQHYLFFHNTSVLSCIVFGHIWQLSWTKS